MVYNKVMVKGKTASKPKTSVAAKVKRADKDIVKAEDIAKAREKAEVKKTSARTRNPISKLKSVAKTKKEEKSTKTKKASKSSKSGMSLYSNLAYKRKVREDARARKKAEELAKLPKNPILRFFARLRPDRVLKAIFSKRGLFTILKIFAALILIIIIGIGGLFLYFKKDLAEIDLEALSNRVQNTVNTYLDRNGYVLWEDKGNGDYRLVVNGDEISTYMRQATVAIEDRNFYNHIGIDFGGLMRAAYVTLIQRGQVQGGSTLTQQLVKQVYFSDEASKRDASGLPRKIKEMILAIEIEKMYDKEQIITLYLNQSPYGGRRNGVESAAQTYFGKSAKDLDLAESALLAAIPNNPGVLNPYNIAGHEKLLWRQRHTLDVMAEMGYITKEQAEEAKAIDILAKILPEQDQYQDIIAPWFVLEVKAQLEAKYGIKTMREGGFTITTTLDLRAQNYAMAAIAEGANYFSVNGSDNACLVSIDVETGQVIAMVGSYNWNREGYGQVNATTSLLEPASTIKPILDYTPLFMQRDGVNYAAGSMIVDNNIDAVYCRGTRGSCRIRNATGRFYGNITFRQALAGSLNIPAVKALYINGIDNSLQVAHALGDKSYCANGETAGLSMAIGGGCGVRPVEHANAYASLARGGVYKDIVYWLEVKNSSGDVIDAWVDNEGTRVVDEQTAYMTTSILSDAEARRFVWGSSSYAAGFYSKNVWLAAKTGTTENGAGKAKDSWVLNYSPVLATAIWNGNHDGRVLRNDSHTVAWKISAAYIDQVHINVYGVDGKWHVGDQIPMPAGMKRATINGKNDVWPSWYNQKNSGVSNEDVIFDSISRKVATECTPPETRVNVTVSKIWDPMTQKDELVSTDYDTMNTDDIHQCTDKRPSASITVKHVPGSGEEDEGTWIITATGKFGTFKLSSYELRVNGTLVKSGGMAEESGTVTYETSTEPKNISFKVVDVGGYTTTTTK